MASGGTTQKLSPGDHARWALVSRKGVVLCLLSCVCSKPVPRAGGLLNEVLVSENSLLKGLELEELREKLGGPDKADCHLTPLKRPSRETELSRL